MKSLQHINKYLLKYKWRLIFGIVFTSISNFFSVYSAKYVGTAFDYLKTPAFGHHLILIEKELKGELEPRLELILESLEDRNNREARTARDTMAAVAAPENA